MKPETSATLKVIATGCFIIFLVFLGISAPFYVRQREVLKTWPTTQAKVDSADIVSAPGKHGSTYMARFLVQYRVGDLVVTSTVNSGYGDRYRSHAQEWIDRFRTGNTVRIAYDPTQPTRVRLNPGYNRYFFAVPLFIVEIGLIFAAAAAVLMIIARRGDAASKGTTPNSVAGAK